MIHCPEGRFPHYAKTCKIVTCFYIDCSNAQLISTRVRFVDLLSSCPPCRSLESSSNEGATLLGIGKVLTLEDLKFPVLLCKGEDGYTIVGERVPEDGSRHTRELRYG